MSDRSHAKRILVAPLDWGLGHATRCIPVIRELLKRNQTVFVASSGQALLVLKDEFPTLTFFEIASYQIQYSKTSFFFSLLWQVPRLVRVIRKEHEQIDRIVLMNNIDIVISDNRFGCYTSRVNCIFMTHQINLLLPRGVKWLEPLVGWINRRFIKKFNQCWVPDEPDTQRVTSKLSTSDKISPVYVGMLSRLNKMPGVDKKFDLLVLLSGPEPQRTLLEEKILKQLKYMTLRVMLVRGLPGNAMQQSLDSGQVDIKSYLSADDLNRVLEESEWVICRSGYSTVMDLARLGKKAIFVPTPGQTEQEYLGKVLQERNIALCVAQGDLDLATVWKEAPRFVGFNQHSDTGWMSQALDKLLA